MRKIFILIVAICLASNGFAQLGGTHNYLDTSYISPRNSAQQSDFLNNSSSFPAKPRDMWQLGAFIGFPYVDGDCPAAFRGLGKGLGSYAWGGGLSLRKAIGYVVSLRGSAAYYNMVGLDYKFNKDLNNIPREVRSQYQSQSPAQYIANYHTQAYVGSLEALISLNNIMFHNKQGRYNFYLLAGYTAFIYQTKMDVLNKDGRAYAYNNNTVNVFTKRSDIRSQLRNLQDGVYETDGREKSRRPELGNYSLRHSFSSGVGLEYRVARKTSVGVEYKRIAMRDDYVDGWAFQSGDPAYPVLTSEWDNVGFLNISVNQNIGNSAKRIPPLWWMNPLEFAYSELSNPKHMKLPKVKLDDADGDGVTDQFDLEPNTPPGAPVDTHGVSKDTDGDGVPDYRDKELLTLQNCFPVDEDGVGNCPEPECCKKMVAAAQPVECKITDLPSVQYKGANSIKLTDDAMRILDIVASKLKADPACKVKVSGHGASNKVAQQISWDRVNAIIRYLVERQGISSSRIIFEYGTEGDSLTVDLMGTMEEGPNTVPAPHPNLRK